MGGTSLARSGESRRDDEPTAASCVSMSHAAPDGSSVASTLADSSKHSLQESHAAMHTTYANYVQTSPDGMAIAKAVDAYMSGDTETAQNFVRSDGQQHSDSEVIGTLRRALRTASKQ